MGPCIRRDDEEPSFRDARSADPESRDSLMCNCTSEVRAAHAPECRANFNHISAISPRGSREFCCEDPALLDQRAQCYPRGEQGMPDAWRVRSRVRSGSKHTR
jgi:hypothetical protein